MDDPVQQAIDLLRSVPRRELQSRGYHLEERSFYTSLNDLPFLEANWDLWHDRPRRRRSSGISMHSWRSSAASLPTWASLPTFRRRPRRTSGVSLGNNFWCDADAAVHYGLLRELKPQRVVEVGCGWSSLLMARALERNELQGTPQVMVDLIEPYPRRELLSALPATWTLHETILQRAPLELFEQLRSGDVCFYDGSHVARAASDVVWFFFEVLPRLAPGVVVHVHDIFWPSDYPDEWILERGQTWNEQYLLQAFLMYNREFEVLVCNAALFQRHHAALDELYRHTKATSHGVSVWLRRRPR